ncbi:MAG: hypothetical protein DCC45_10250 [Armatimonadetes bacterium]|nr:MAG: hypothetical protein EDM73_09365 [Armatimonadota bacterium]RIJ95319.1 MAG: hypothetical protein DCC45_10250 [Armatimonadota bacterium]
MATALGLVTAARAIFFYECEQFDVVNIKKACITASPECDEYRCEVETYKDWRCRYNFFAQCNLEHNAWALATLSTYACTYSAGFGCVCPHNLGAQVLEEDYYQVQVNSCVGG